MGRKVRIRPKILSNAPVTRDLASGTLRPKLLVSIVNLKDEKRLKEILDDCSVGITYQLTGTGTAQSAVLDYLGIAETEKAVLFSLFPESDEETVLRLLREEMTLYLAGKGISFTIPLAGVSQTVADGITGAATNKVMEGSKIMRSSDRKYDLIVACVGANFIETAVDAARSKGAAGGTFISGRAMQNAKAEQFVGISLVKEQEVLLILSRKEVTPEIMAALSDSVGAQTEAAGVIFSLPVDRTAGISAAEETELALASDGEEKA